MSAAEGSLFARIRERCAAVAAGARSVHIDAEALARLADSLAAGGPQTPDLDPAHRPFPEPDTTLAFVLTLDAVNFGSGWFPALRKRPGLSGYGTLASALRERFETKGAPSARELGEMTARDCAALFQQPLEPPVDELMALFARALADLGAFLREHGRGGRFAAPVEEAAGSAEALVRSLAQMPLYQDVAHWGGSEVPFYKRAQITAADLALAFGGEGPGHFHDLAELTLFADNLVPHVLRMEGVLRYPAELVARIEREEPIASGSPEEVEIRAVAVHAVEELVRACGERGWPTTAQRLDGLLWTRGQRPAMKAVPRHRTRCTFY